MGAAAAVVLGAGYYLAGKLERDSRGRVAEYAAAAPSESEPDPAEAVAKDGRAFAEQAFDEGIVADAKAFGLAEAGLVDAVHGAQAYFLELDEPKVLAPGRSWTSDHLSVEAIVDKVKYQQHGATVSARHSLAVVENISDRPIAYHVRVSSDARGRCDVHGARQHNAMALMPGEKAEIVVCAGGGKIQLLRAEVLEISEIGHRYISRVPPRAVGVNSLSSHAHAPAKGTKLCETVDVSGLAVDVREGLTRWVDIVDFYSRHSCDRFRFVPGYHYSPDPPAKLPVDAPAD